MSDYQPITEAQAVAELATWFVAGVCGVLLLLLFVHFCLR